MICYDQYATETRSMSRARAVAFILAVTCLALSASHAWADTPVRRVGILTLNDEPLLQMPLKQALREQGWIEGKNIAYEYRTAGGDPGRFADPAAELVRSKVDVLLAIGPPAVRAAYAATRDIPIVAHDLETDPVAAGYAQSYSRPGGNLTGLVLDSPDLSGKWVELLKSVVPNLSRVAVLWDSTSGPVPLHAIQTVAPAMGIGVQVLELRAPAEIDGIAAQFQGRRDALIVLPSPMLYYENVRLVALVKKQRLPATSMFIRFADTGGLISYGPDMPATVVRCTQLVAKILNGAKPGDLPIERPVKFEFVVNLKTAKSLRLTIPDPVLVRADRVVR